MAVADLLVAVCILYAALLFAVAWFAERRARRGRGGWLRSPVVYTLTLSVYCTAWTFYGAVGFAARSGLDYLTIYLGPTLVFLAWRWLLRKLVRIGRSQRLTSIADLVSSRFGKSDLLAVLVTVLAVIGTTPYIALQLQSITLSFAAFAHTGPEAGGRPGTAIWVAAGLAVFTILFGTRSLDANHRHHGVMIAIALEAVVKLAALVAVGVFVVWGLSGGLGPALDAIDAAGIAAPSGGGGRWLALIFLAAAAVLTLPRMFQVTVVENADERHLATAAWAFPLYLLGISLFVLPIAAAGLALLPQGSNPDLFVLTLPLAADRDGLALFAFLGGFSSATSMIVVAALALSIMVSNHIVVPLWLRFRRDPATVAGDLRTVVLRARRSAIAGVLMLGYGYYVYTDGTAALASIGLISFAGVAQILPALLGAVYWRGATRAGAIAGLAAGFALWGYTLFLPSFGDSLLMPAGVIAEGPFGIAWLRAQNLLGTGGDPLVHALVWSLGANALLFAGVSLVTRQDGLERLQASQFVDVFDRAPGPVAWSGGGAAAWDLLVMSQRILGPEAAQALFRRAARGQGLSGDLPDPTPDFVEMLERELAGSVGAAAAHAMIRQLTGAAAVSVEELIAVAGETREIMAYSSRLEEKSRELARTAEELRAANEKLTQISRQKDAFLSQISHELRTPMASIRAFSEILRDTDDLAAAELTRFAALIHDETLRLTRLLDDLLDLSVLENGRVSLNIEAGNLGDVIESAVGTAVLAPGRQTLAIRRDTMRETVPIETDCGRLRQVFINLITNARKYCDAERPELRIRVTAHRGMVDIDFIDNGSGVPAAQRALIFEKFARAIEAETADAAGGAGLGLAICREVMRSLGGSIGYLPGVGGAAFRVRLPRRSAAIAAQ
jgi:Na+/proline symporter/nitrogen-specific signal transduction histidine kinase